MALTITRQTGSSSNLGLAAKMPLYSVQSSFPLHFGIYDVTFDSSYPTNGESISNITNGDFNSALFVGIEQKDTNTASDFRILRYDYTNQVLLVYTDGDATPAEAGNGSDQSAVEVRLLVVGYPF